MLDSTLRRKIREAFDIRNPQVPVVVAASTKPVEISGEIGGYFTLAGEPIQYPSGYAKRGWSNMTYHTDSRQIAITPEWLRLFIRSARPYSS